MNRYFNITHIGNIFQLHVDGLTINYTDPDKLKQELSEWIDSIGPVQT